MQSPFIIPIQPVPGTLTPATGSPGIPFPGFADRSRHPRETREPGERSGRLLPLTPCFGAASLPQVLTTGLAGVPQLSRFRRHRPGPRAGLANGSHGCGHGPLHQLHSLPALESCPHSRGSAPTPREGISCAIWSEVCVLPGRWQTLEPRASSPRKKTGRTGGLPGPHVFPDTRGPACHSGLALPVGHVSVFP